MQCTELHAQLLASSFEKILGKARFRHGSFRAVPNTKHRS